MRITGSWVSFCGFRAHSPDIIRLALVGRCRDTGKSMAIAAQPELTSIPINSFGYLLGAIFDCAQYQRLGIHYREHRILRVSFWVKLTFIVVELSLAIAFGATQYHHTNAAAVIE